MITYEFKLYHNHHTKRLDRLISVAQRTYNHFITLCYRHYRLFNKHLGLKCSLGTQYYKLQKHLTKLKHTDKFSWMKQLDAQALQNILERIVWAYTLYFKALKANRQSSPPKRKKYWKYKSITYKQNGWKLDQDNHTIQIQGHSYKYFQSRQITFGKIKTVTIKRKNNEWYVYLTVDGHRQPIISTTGKSVGFDFGLKTYLTGSDGTQIQSPLFFRKNINQIKRLHRQLSRKVRGSTHWVQCLHQLQKAYEHMSNQRKDFHFKLALNLVRQYDIICLETLNIKAMCRRWGRKVNDLGFYGFTLILNYMSCKYHKKVVYIDQWYPSSQLCSKCGYRYIELRGHLEMREWTCPRCGHYHSDRDFNAARNIEVEGLRQIDLM